MEALGLFFTYALTAIFVENILFTRALGLGRMAFFGSPKKILYFSAALTIVTFFGSLLGFGVNYLLYDYSDVSTALRALIYLVCISLIYAALYAISAKLPYPEIIRRQLPLAAFNSAALGALILSVGTQNSLASTAGLGLGTGIGYTLALFMIYLGKKRLELIALPRAFKGMPIMLLYIGIISLAVYGLIGHQLPS